MSPKRKLWLSIVSLCMVVILGVTSIAVVLASLSANVNNNFSITYTPHNVKATLAGSYTLDDVVTNMSSSGVPGAINFDGSETGSKNFDSIGNIELKKGQTLELNYAILNYDDKKSLPVSAELLNAPENLKVTYSTSLFDGNNTTTNSQTMTANTPTPTIEVPFSTYSTFDEIKSYVTELDSQDCALATRLFETITQNFNDFEIQENVTKLNPRSILFLKWIMTFLIIGSLDSSSSAVTMGPNETTLPDGSSVFEDILIEWTLAGQLFGRNYTLSSKHDSLAEWQMILAERGFGDYLQGAMLEFIDTEFPYLFIPAQLEQTSPSSSFSIASYIKALQSFIFPFQMQFLVSDGANSNITTKGNEEGYESFLLDFQSELNAFVMESFPKYDNSSPYDFSLNPIKIDNNTKANLMFETCKLLNIPCLYITIKFEIADTTLPASFNGGVNINLGKS